jgi:hypothetical protein
LRLNTLNEIIFEGIPSRIKYSGQLKKNISKLASHLKGGCFYGKPQYRAVVAKENGDEIDMMADVANLVVNKGRLNLKEMRLQNPTLKQKHLLANIIALMNENIPVNHQLSLEEFVEQNNEKLHGKYKERRSDAKLLSIFRRVLPNMNLLFANSFFTHFRSPYLFADRRSHADSTTSSQSTSKTSSGSRLSSWIERLATKSPESYSRCRKGSRITSMRSWMPKTS